MVRHHPVEMIDEGSNPFNSANKNKEQNENKNGNRL